MSIHEYTCGNCGQSFVGDGAPTEEHGTCGGVGTLVKTYGARAVAAYAVQPEAADAERADEAAIAAEAICATLSAHSASIRRATGDRASTLEGRTAAIADVAGVLSYGGSLDELAEKIEGYGTRRTSSAFRDAYLSTLYALASTLNGHQAGLLAAAVAR